jgi:hypothetical protein
MSSLMLAVGLEGTGEVVQTVKTRRLRSILVAFLEKRSPAVDLHVASLGPGGR